MNPTDFFGSSDFNNDNVDTGSLAFTVCQRAAVSVRPPEPREQLESYLNNV